MERLTQFQIKQRTMRYSQFVVRLYNWCISLGFESGKILPSHTFCSDENQGYPIILINKHFGNYPFTYGKEAGIVATKRFATQARHGLLTMPETRAYSPHPAQWPSMSAPHQDLQL